jgi:VIT1/CCC1 family predicted Fe2+/Mn2+ transporter
MSETVLRAGTSGRVLDPVERISEILFGLIMVLTFTGSLSVAEAGHAEVREMLVGAIGCNLAWGLVDAVMYLMASVTERARGLLTLRAVRLASDPAAAHRLIADALPPVVSTALTGSDLEMLRQRVRDLPAVPADARLGVSDGLAAVGVFLLVFLSTFPVVIPFLLMSEPGPALRASNAIAVAMLFLLGWSLGSFSGRPAWRTGCAMVVLGTALVGITIALGG